MTKLSSVTSRSKPSTMDATAVKAEIKSWEHQFRAQNGRSATIEDVKALPSIGVSFTLRACSRPRAVTDAFASHEV